MDKSKFQRFRQYQVVEGSLDDFMAGRDSALVGVSLAKRKGWKVGQTVDLSAQLGLLFKLAGIYASGSEEHDNLVIMDIGYVQDRFDARGHANIIVAKLSPSARAEDVAQALDKLPKPVGTRTQAETAFLSGMIDDLSDMIAISRIVILITLAVVLASVANAVSMNVRERTRQIGIMRTLGFGRMRVLAVVLGEAALVCLVGGLFGALGAWCAMQVQEFTVQARNLNLSVDMPWRVVVWAAGLALGVGLLGGAWPAWRASRQGIVASLGSTE